jgi:hypothetical protein
MKLIHCTWIQYALAKWAQLLSKFLLVAEHSHKQFRIPTEMPPEAVFI